MLGRFFLAQRKVHDRTAPTARPLIDRLRLNRADPSYAAADRRRDFAAVLAATPAGRRVQAQILARCRVCDRSFVPGDSLETARREGMRDIGLWLLEMLEEEAQARPASAQAEPGVGQVGIAD